MKKFSKIMENYFIDLLKELEKTNSEKTIIEIANNLDSNQILKMIIYYFVKYCLKNNILINSFEILKSVGISDLGGIYFMNKKNNLKKENKNIGIIKNKLIFSKGVLYSMLEKMNLKKTTSFLKKKMIFEDEIETGVKSVEPLDFISKEDINFLKLHNFEEILQKELKEKYTGQPIILHKTKIDHNK